MIKYIALLRGINVGGKNKIPMADLRKTFEAYGFTDVSIYINSGNIFFTSTEKDPMSLKTICQNLIFETLNLEISVCVLSTEELIASIENAPERWNQDKESVNNVIFIIPPMTFEELQAEIGAPKIEHEQIIAHGNTIYWTAPLKTYSRSRWSHINTNPIKNMLQFETQTQ